MVTGRCLCGAVQFILKQDVKRVVLCHCKFCRRAHGSAFAASVLIKVNDLELQTPQEKITNYEARYFCSVCATRLYNRSPSDAPYMNLMVATLDVEPSANPVAHVNVSSKAPWFRIGDNGVQYPEFPSQEQIASAVKQLE